MDVCRCHSLDINCQHYLTTSKMTYVRNVHCYTVFTNHNIYRKKHRFRYIFFNVTSLVLQHLYFIKKPESIIHGVNNCMITVRHILYT